MSEAAARGTMKVAVRWEGIGAEAGYVMVQIQPLGQTAEQWQARTDRKGLCALELPAGTYEIAVGRGSGAEEKTRVEVKGRSTTEVPLVMSAPTGLTVPAGKGKRIKAGSGIRQGAWQTLGAADGLWGQISPRSGAMLQDREGNLWFGTGTGVSRYEGRQFTTFTTANGLAGNFTSSILPDREGNLWFGTSNGASRYDGKTWTTFPTPEGQADSWVGPLLQDRDSNLWFGTAGGRVCQYDGKKLVDFSAQVGLAGNTSPLIPSMEDQRGYLWFGTWGAGICVYDGTVFQRLQKPDGLPSELVWDITQTRNGDIWVATEGGATRYRPGKFPPVVRLVEVLADRSYGPAAEIDLPSTQDYLSFVFEGASLRTRPERMVYVYRLLGYADPWRQVNEGRVEYTDLPVGNYVFEVKAVAPDLNYSEPATVKVTVHLPYTQLALSSGLALALVGMATASGYALRKRRAQRQAERAFLQEQRQRLQAQEALNQELEKELQTAHELQMGLMPKEAPQLPGLDLAGRCIPANHVGGDFFQYFHQEGQLTIALADVTGHAMEAAIPMVMFSGILKSQMETGSPVEELFGRLNRSLHGTLSTRTFVCFAMGELDPHTGTFCLANAGCPYPYHYRAANGEVMELQMDAYPLGVRPDTAYRVIEVQLEPGDRVVFCSDGIIEATDGAGEQFGYERTAQTIGRGCAAGLSAAALLERIVAEVRAFTGEAPQGDDRTIVVLRVLDASTPAS